MFNLKSKSNMKSFKNLFNYFSGKNYLFDEIGDDIVVFKNVVWKDYYEISDNNSEIMSVEYDYDYMNRRVYNIILVRNKKVYGNNNMDKLFKEELLKYIGDEKKVLLSEFYNKFNNKSVFGLLYNFLPILSNISKIFKDIILTSSIIKHLRLYQFFNLYFLLKTLFNTSSIFLLANPIPANLCNVLALQFNKILAHPVNAHT